MNSILFYSSVAAFLLLPPALLLARWRRSRAMPWWAILIAILGGGWLLMIAAVDFHHAAMFDEIEALEDPPRELRERWAADGGKRAFSLLFGWLVGAIYALPYLLLYGAAAWLRRPSSSRPRS